MSVREKLDKLAEAAVDSLYTGEVQALIFGIGWGIVSRILDVPRTFDLTPITSMLPAEWAGTMPTAVTPGFFVIVSIMLIVGKGFTPGKLPFVSNRTKPEPEGAPDA